MTVTRCSWGTCKSDARCMKNTSMKVFNFNFKKGEHFFKHDIVTGFKEQVDFYQFPRPVYKDKAKTILDDMRINTIKCKEWLKACNRPNTGFNSLTIKQINFWHFVCSKVSI